MSAWARVLVSASPLSTRRRSALLDVATGQYILHSCADPVGIDLKLRSQLLESGMFQEGVRQTKAMDCKSLTIVRCRFNNSRPETALEYILLYSQGYAAFSGPLEYQIGIQGFDEPGIDDRNRYSFGLQSLCSRQAWMNR